MRSYRFLVTLVAVATLSVAIDMRGDSLVVSGAGSSGTWITEVELANPTTTPLPIEIYLRGEYTAPCAFPVCVPLHVTIPANATTSIALTDAVFNSTTYLQTIFITPADLVTLPVVRAQAMNTAPPNQTVLLPVARLSTLTSLMPQVLTFPAATRTDSFHSNVAIGAIAPDGSSPLFAVRIDVLDKDGALLASGEFSDSMDTQGVGGTNIFLIDVLGYLGITSLEDGQIRVTRTSGEGALWGEMASLGGNGCVLMTQGINP